MDLDAAPVQRYGRTGDGQIWYFRSRFDRWVFGVAPSDTAAVRVAFGLRNGFRCMGTYGPRGGFEASYMPIDEAEEIIEDCLLLYGCEK